MIADSDDTLVVEGNHYFPRESVDEAHLQPSDHTTHCDWKGEAHYFNVIVGDEVNENAAWYYPSPKEAAAEIAGRVAFWKGIRVEPATSS